MKERLQIELSKAEALLLFEGLAKLEEKKLLDAAVCEEERSAFWALEAVLEKSLPVFATDYLAQVEAAKRELKGENA